ncbi:MAG: N-acetyltransferase, partial [Clostridia bacterium]|nr:N-acetyltransferase [Clostridia bacterium]
MNAKVDITNTVLETPRLILRPWKTSDIDDFFEYAKVPGVGEMAGWPHHTSKDTSKMVMESFIEGKN